MEPTGNLENEVSLAKLAAVAAKFEQENKKRLRPDGSAQYVELDASEPLEYLTRDLWVDHEALNKLQPNLKDGDSVKVLILGAGWGGLLTAVRLVEAGWKRDDIRIVDLAGGFGGTWYWNRYPGLMCDVESSVYLPLLEETGYMPKTRFAYGPELQAYADHIAEKWNLTNLAVFRTRTHSYEWDEATHRWHVVMTQDRGPNEPSVKMTVDAQFVILQTSAFNNLKAPNIPGIEDFAGDMMHTSRWNYAVTGGSPSDPTLSGLKGKKVAIIGTGATAVQIAPQVSKWAAKLYVFQRTASAVAERGQRSTDPDAWKQMTSKKGWWKARVANWTQAVHGLLEEDEIQIDDGWRQIRGYKNMLGAPHDTIYTLENIPGLVQQALMEDIPRMEKLHKRIDDIVTKDKQTADGLKAWYPQWCKRPCFHDDYLPIFNLPSVTLVDTDGKGVESITHNAVVADGKEYEVDVLILSTGYRSPFRNGSDPCVRSNVTVKGREQTFSQSWAANGATSLHGVLSNSFPNLFHPGASQAGASSNFVHIIDVLSRHMAYLMTEAVKRSEDPDTVTIEPSKEAAEAWGREIMAGAGWFSPFGVCGPSYLNNEGEAVLPEDMLKRARSAPYSQGILAFDELLEKWRVEGSMQGIVIGS